MSSAMSRVRAGLGIVLFLGLVTFLVFSGIMPRLRARQVLRQQTNLLAEPVVIVSPPERASPAEEIVLPGNIQAFIDAPIYARTNGYLKRWYFDIGARIKQGQLLAEIETPEVAHQLQQARADLATAQANLSLAHITSQRYTDLFKTDSVAKQDVDNAVQDAAAKEANVKAATANVARLQQLYDFQKVYAPFDGVITARNTDIGQLIDSGSSGGPARELFHIASIEKLRVFVNVPQAYSHQTTVGMKADLTLPEIPGRRFAGSLVRTADSLDPATRTLLVEVDVTNSTGQLFPGAYSEVHFAIRSASTTLIIPAESLVFRSEGVRVPVVKDNKVALLPVIVGRDFGRTVEVISGLKPDSAVIMNPPDSLVEGEIVRVSKTKPAKEVEEDN